MHAADPLRLPLGQHPRAFRLTQPARSFRRPIDQEPDQRPKQRQRAQQDEGQAPVERGDQGSGDQHADRRAQGAAGIEYRRKNAALGSRRPFAHDAGANRVAGGFPDTKQQACADQGGVAVNNAGQRRTECPDDHAGCRYKACAQAIDQHAHENQERQIAVEKTGKDHAHGSRTQVELPGDIRPRDRNVHPVQIIHGVHYEKHDWDQPTLVTCHFGRVPWAGPAAVLLIVSRATT